MYTIAMAYCGTGSNAAIRRLLHVAVSDVNDDVRRAAVMALGFILFKTPEQCPSLVSLLSESYNPHVRSVPSSSQICVLSYINLEWLLCYHVAQQIGV
jgi:HEAT repeat protein